MREGRLAEMFAHVYAELPAEVEAQRQALAPYLDDRGSP